MKTSTADSVPPEVRGLHGDYTDLFERFFDFHIAAREPRARHLLKGVNREIERLALSDDLRTANEAIEELSWLKYDLEELLYALKHGGDAWNRYRQDRWPDRPIPPPKVVTIPRTIHIPNSVIVVVALAVVVGLVAFCT